MYREFDHRKWEPFIERLSNYFKYLSKIHHAVCSTLDLKQEAWLALLKAAKRFDETKGVKFITYAYAYTYKELLKYVGRNTKTRHILRSYEDLKQNSNRPGYNEPGCDVPNDASIVNQPAVSGLHIAEQKDTLDFLLSGLSPEERSLIDDRYFKESTIVSIAEKSGAATQTITKKLTKTLGKMQRAAKREKHKYNRMSNV